MAATGSRRAIDRCFAITPRCSARIAGTTPARWSWRDNWPRRLHAPLVTSTVSRLLIDLNRSIGHPQLFSAATRSAVQRCASESSNSITFHTASGSSNSSRRSVSRGRRVIHISSHSFTPELYGKVRQADVGLLYDPRRRGEVKLCARWKETLARMAPDLRVRRNYPYAGKGDGLTSYLRQQFPPRRLRRHRTRDQPEDRICRGPALDGGASCARGFPALPRAPLERASMNPGDRK